MLAQPHINEKGLLKSHKNGTYLNHSHIPEIRAEVHKTIVAKSGIPDLPDVFNWLNFEDVVTKRYLGKHPAKDRLKGTRFITDDVPNQASCGGCWAVASTSMLASAYAIWSLTDPVRLSAAQATYCTSTPIAQNCCGGLPEAVYQYTLTNGLVTEDEFPWQCTFSTEDRDDCQCHEQKQESSNQHLQTFAQQCATKGKIFSHENMLYKFTDGEPNEIIERIKHEIFAFGPVVACYYVFADFQYPMYPNTQAWAETKNIYIHGAYTKRLPGAEKQLLGGHAVMVVGWDEEELNGKTVGYWIAQNSWSSDWNNGGDMLTGTANPARVKNPGGYFKIAMYPYNQKVLFDIPDARFGAMRTWAPKVEIAGKVITAPLVPEHMENIVNGNGDGDKNAPSEGPPPTPTPTPTPLSPSQYEPPQDHVVHTLGLSDHELNLIYIFLGIAGVAVLGFVIFMLYRYYWRRQKPIEQRQSSSSSFTDESSSGAGAGAVAAVEKSQLR